jgi:hypothetical protein
MPGASFVVSTSLSAVRRLHAADWIILAEAVVTLAVARVAILIVPFRKLAPRLGTPMRESPATTNETDRARLRQVAWAIGAISRRAPWRCKCLEQAFAANRMLRRRNIVSTLYFGIARPGGEVTAHAWVRSGDYYVTGGAERAHFQILSTFAAGISD